MLLLYYIHKAGGRLNSCLRGGVSSRSGARHERGQGSGAGRQPGRPQCMQAPQSWTMQSSRQKVVQAGVSMVQQAVLLISDCIMEYAVIRVRRQAGAQVAWNKEHSSQASPASNRQWSRKAGVQAGVPSEQHAVEQES